MYLSDGYPQATAHRFVSRLALRVYLSNGYPRANLPKQSDPQLSETDAQHSLSYDAGKATEAPLPKGQTAWITYAQTNAWGPKG